MRINLVQDLRRNPYISLGSEKEAELRVEVGAVMLMALVVGSVGLASYVGTQPAATTTGAETSGSACAQGAPIYSVNPVTLTVLMKPGSSGIVCILYGGNLDQPSPPINEPANIYAIGRNGSYLGNANGTVAGINATFLAVVARGLANETVEYSITVAPNAQDGAYALWIGSSCPGFPLVVGDNITGVIPNLNHYYANPWSCPSANYHTLMVGASAGITLESF